MENSKLINDLNSIDNSKESDNKLDLATMIKQSFSSSSDSSNTDDHDRDDSNDWLKIINRKVAKSKKETDRYTYEDYDNLGVSGKDKKKKKNKDGIIDYDREFGNEIAILKSMEVQQAKFVDDLTKEYNNMRSSKSSARGVTKYMTELIESITSARTVNIQIVKEIIAAKKIIAELSIKEREKLLKDTLNTSQGTMNDYASAFMRELFKTGRSNILDSQISQNNDDEYYEDYDSEDIYQEIVDLSSDSTMMSDEDKERELFLKYENTDVTISVLYDDDTGEWEFIAQDEHGNVLEDYPLPIKTNKMTFNIVNETATDEYGQKYHMIIQ